MDLFAKSVLLCLTLLPCLVPSFGLLQPQESESREIKSLDGIWNFRKGSEHDSSLGFREKWYENQLTHTKNGFKEVIPMPVPSSYNDITTVTNNEDFFYIKQF